MEKQYIISIKKYHYLKMVELGFSLIEVSLSIVLLSSAMLFMWQTSKAEDDIYLSREYGAVICQYLAAFDSFLSEKQNGYKKEEVKLEHFKQYLPNNYQNSAISRSIKFYTTEKGVGLIVLEKDNNQKKSSTRRSFLGFRTAYIKNDHIYSYDKYIQVPLTEFSFVPENDKIEIMAIIPKEKSYVKRCLIDFLGEE